MLIFLWLLQISLIGPYYEKDRTQAIALRANDIQRFIEKTNGVPHDNAGLVSIMSHENMCAGVYDINGKRLMSADILGLNCHLNQITDASLAEFIAMAQIAPSHDFSIRFNSEYFDQGMHFYGREVAANDASYYVFINAPIELLDSTVSVLKRQFGLVAGVVFTISTIVTFILSKKLSDPISDLTKEALKLADGNLSVTFDGHGYQEVETLSSTLNFATAEFKKTDELRRDLVANVSHDIKTPLTMIKAYAEMIQDISGDNPELREKHLGVIVEEVEHLERMVNDMLTLSKYESNVLVINPSVFNVYQHIESCTNLFQVLDIDFDIECDRALYAYADDIKMGQILYNYINNATRFLGEDRKIIVKARVVQGVIEISVTDHGPGIEPEVLKHVWDRYYKIDKHFQRQEHSSGLGLAIVKAIATAAQSKVWVESVPGEFTTFYYTMPLKRKS